MKIMKRICYISLIFACSPFLLFVFGLALAFSCLDDFSENG
jgi:hypothetical protein